MADDRQSKLFITFGIFLVLLNFPMLAIVDKPELWRGVPVLYWYFFLLWAAMILIIALIMRKKK